MTTLITQSPGLPKSFRRACRRSRTRGDGVRSFRLGATCDWWPCLGGPFVQFYVGFWVHDFWWGTPSYSNAEGDCMTHYPKSSAPLPCTLLDSRLPDAEPIAPVRILLVVLAVVTGVGFLWVCAYSDLPNYYFQP